MEKNKFISDGMIEIERYLSSTWLGSKPQIPNMLPAKIRKGRLSENKYILVLEIRILNLAFFLMVYVSIIVIFDMCAAYEFKFKSDR